MTSELLRPETIHELSLRLGDVRAEGPALSEPRAERPRRLSYAELGQRVAAVGTALLHMGVERGDRLAILAENRLEWPVAYLAASSVGALAVPLDIFLTPSEVETVLHRAEPRLAFTSYKYLDKIAAARRSLPERLPVVCFDDHQRLVTSPGPAEGRSADAARAAEQGRAEATRPRPFEAHDHIHFRALVAAGEALREAGSRRFESVDLRPEDRAAIVFLSTTLGVELTHRGILKNAAGTLEMLGVAATAGSRWLSVLPFHHAWPTTNGLIAPLLAGAHNTLVATTKFDVLFEVLREHDADYLMLVPLLVERLFQSIYDHAHKDGLFRQLALDPAAPPTEHFQQALQTSDGRQRLDQTLRRLGLGGLSCLLSAGAHLFASTTAKLKMLGLEVCDVYGLTETSPVLTHAAPGDNRPGSAGRSLPEAQVAIHAPDEHGNGEIIARGPVLMAGYFRDPEGTRAMFDDDGWLHTGDIGRLDEEGHLYVTGRLKNIIVNQGGKNIYPEEGEAALRQSELIADAVLIPRCVGEREFPYAVIRPDLDRLAAWEKRRGKRLTDAELDELIRGEIHQAAERIAHYKLPEDFELTWEPIDAAALRAEPFMFDQDQPYRTAPPPTAGDGPMARSADPLQQALAPAIARYMCERIAEIVDVEASEIDLEMSFFGYLTSLDIVEVSARIEEQVRIKLYPPMLFEHPNVLRLTRYFAQEFRQPFLDYLGTEALADGAAAPVTATPVTSAGAAPARAGRPRSAPAREPIAIIGIAGAFPGSPDVDEYWRHLAAGDDLITEIPPDRFAWEEYYGDPLMEPNKMSTKWGGFVADMDKFDPAFFGMSIKEARLMDPQHRVLLETVWAAIEDAGIRPASLQGRPVGLFAGVTCYDYADIVRRATGEAGVYTYSGTSPSILPNRISYVLGLHGPSEAVDTACSSALIAIHRARRALLNDECEMAIAGGVNALLSPELFICFSKSGMLSPEGRCKTFSSEADGYVRGEGAGAVLLKRLSHAEADGDHVYATIRGSASNHGGRASSMTSPNPNAQAELLRAAYEDAELSPDTVSYIEAHGTGTSLGDPIEITGLKKGFDLLYERAGQEPTRRHHCGLGSVKTNIGHLESAAGIASIVKVVLAMRHGELPPSLHSAELSPYLDLTDSPFYIVRERQRWERLRDTDGTPVPRRAGVSSFGVGGANAHVVLEERPADPPAAADDGGDGGPELVVLSAKTEERLRAQADRLVRFLARAAEPDRDAAGHGAGALRLRDLAYTLQVGRNEQEERFATVVTRLDELRRQLAALAEGDDAGPSSIRGTVARGKKLAELEQRRDEPAAAVEQALAQSDLPRLGELWCGGAAVDWARLCRPTPPHRIPLPTYPFARRRCWVGEKGR